MQNRCSSTMRSSPSRGVIGPLLPIAGNWCAIASPTPPGAISEARPPAANLKEAETLAGKAFESWPDQIAAGVEYVRATDDPSEARRRCARAKDALADDPNADALDHAVSEVQARAPEP